MAILNGDVASTGVLVSSGADSRHLVKMFALADLYRALVRKDHRDLKVTLAVFRCILDEFYCDFD